MSRFNFVSYSILVVGFGVISTREEKILKGARVKYNKILSNTGQYDRRSHHFRCPVTGYYMFSLGAASNKYHSDIAILMNGHRIVSKYFNNNKTILMCSTCQVITESTSPMY